MTVRFLVFALIFSCLGFSQDAKYFNTFRSYFSTYPESPSTAQFMKYGGVNNNEYTGTNSPHINLFNVTEGSLSLPINLSYISGNGIKANEEAGSVGLGWSIPLPAITQTVMGFDDFSSSHVKMRQDYFESNTPNMYDFPKCLESYPWTVYNKKCEGPTNFDASPSFSNFGFAYAYDWSMPLNGYFDTLYLGKTIMAFVDAEPDIFILNLFGNKIEFIIENFPYSFGRYDIGLPVFKVLNDKGYKISYENKRFFVTDKSGIIYIFSDIEEVVTIYHRDFVKHRNFLLTEIRSIKGDLLTFSYENLEERTNPTTPSEHTYYRLTNNAPDGDGESYYTPDGIFDFNSEEPIDGVVKTFDRKVYYSPSVQNYKLIKEITGQFGRLVFEYSDRIDFSTLKIDFIKQYDSSNTLINIQSFEYNYFNSCQGTPTTLSVLSDLLTKRLKLVSVQKNNLTPYFFEYNNTLFCDKSSKAVDYWGFYNGGLTNISYALNPTDFNGGLIKYYVPLNNEFTNNFKRSNLTYLKAGMLEKIIYPTGGYSVFDYEENTADNLFIAADFSVLSKGNGLRLVKQRNYDFDDKIIESKKYTYFEGKSMRPLALAHQNFYRKISYQNEFNNYLQGSILSNNMLVKEGTYIMLSSNNVMGYSPLSDGDYVGYTNVVTTQINENETDYNGKIETIYSNEVGRYVTPHTNIPLMGIPQVKGDKIDNGLVVTQKTYNVDNILISETINDYLKKTSIIDYGVVIKDWIKFRNWYEYTLKNSDYYILNIEQNPVTALGYYPIYSNQSLLKSSKTISYYPSGNKEIIAEYTYDGNSQKDKEIIKDVSNTSQTKKYFYPHTNDYIGQSKFESYWSNKNRLSEIVQTEEYLGDKLIKRDWIDYKQQGNLVVPATIYTQRADSNTDEVKKVHLTHYDNKANVLQISEENGLSKVIIWGYNKTQPIAKIENATYESVNTQLARSGLTIETTNETHITTLNNLRTQLPEAMITTYTHIPLVGVATVTDPRGRTTTYSYDNNNRLHTIRDHEGKLQQESLYNYKQ